MTEPIPETTPITATEPTTQTPIAVAAASASTARPAAFRWQAFGIHLAISMVILAVLLYLLFFYWFPDYLFDTDGGWQALRVIAGVDIVLGPLLTLIAANPRKTTAVLRKDFTIIALIQVLALSWGTWLAWDSRPYAVFWYDGAFHSLPYSAFSDAPDAKRWIAENTRQNPRLVFIDLPEDPAARSRVLLLTVQRKTSALFNAALYRPWPGDGEQVRRHGTAILREIGRDPAMQQRYTAAVQRKNMDPNSVLPIPVRSRYSSYFLLLSRQSYVPMTALDIAPDEKWLIGLYSTRNLDELPISPTSEPTSRSGTRLP